jgi:hypothetical protein
MTPSEFEQNSVPGLPVRDRLKTADAAANSLSSAVLAEGMP